MSVNFDVCILGAGVAGVMAAYRIAKEHPGLETAVIEMGRPFRKRRRQLDGALGCLPNSDGKLYLQDLNNVAKICGQKEAKKGYDNFIKLFDNISDMKVNKDKKIHKSIEAKLKKHNFEISNSDYIQIIPTQVHQLSKLISTDLENYEHVKFIFDNEVFSVTHEDNEFIIETQYGSIVSKKLVLALGRSGWRLNKTILENLGLITSNNVAKFGVKVETSSDVLHEFNESMCTLTRDDVEIGPFMWHGTVIPEDHVDVVTTAFRSNENRWKTDKVSFNIITNSVFNGDGFEQTERIAKLAFILCNDRVMKERLSNVLTGKSKVSIFSEYNWLPAIVEELSSLIPNLINKSNFYIPTIKPFTPEFKLNKDFSTDFENLYIIGESAGVSGLLSAAIMGYAATPAIVK